MGLHLPGSSFVNPGTPLRQALTEATAARVTQLAKDASTPIGELVDEKAIVNACVALLATGGSTNHTLHLPAIAAAAGISLSWDDLSDLSAVVPLIARVYPNGSADVNHFAAAGGLQVVIRTLLDAGLLHEDVQTVAGPGLSRYLEEPRLLDGELTWVEGPETSLDPAILRTADDPFDKEGGLRVVQGNLGKGVVKVSAVAPDMRSITAPARVFDDQDDLIAAFQEGTLVGDFVAVIRHQGPSANGMPELHKLTPPLGVLQGRGQRVAIVTDGRMSGASGKVLAAIHVTPEASHGGPLSRVRDGDLITVDASSGTLSVDADLSTREPHLVDNTATGTGRELFRGMRHLASSADSGASFFNLAHRGVNA
jgi:phosphogluconate dehydratase